MSAAGSRDARESFPRWGQCDEELADPRSALSEAYRSLCTALQFTTESGLPRTLVGHQLGAVGRQVD